MLRTKALSILIYHADLSYRKTRKVLDWYRKCEDLFVICRSLRRAIGVDKTKLKLKNKHVSV